MKAAVGGVRQGRARCDDRGSGTVLALALVAGLVTAITVLAVGVATLADRTAAQAGADAGALAGATHARAAVASGEAATHACDWAARAARGSGASLLRCVVGPAARVEVTVRVGRATAKSAAEPAYAQT